MSGSLRASSINTALLRTIASRAPDDATGIPSLLRKLGDLGIGFKDLETGKSSLEDIFVDLVGERA